MLGTNLSIIFCKD